MTDQNNINPLNLPDTEYPMSAAEPETGVGADGMTTAETDAGADGAEAASETAADADTGDTPGIFKRRFGMSRVYAGPAPNKPVAMLVYAGPAYFNSQRARVPDASAPIPDSSDASAPGTGPDSSPVAPASASVSDDVSVSQQDTPGSAAPFSGSAESLITCPGCGSQYPFSQRFCNECGTINPTQRPRTDRC